MSYARDKGGGGAGAIAARAYPSRSAPSVIVSDRAGRQYRVALGDVLGGKHGSNPPSTLGTKNPTTVIAGKANPAASRSGHFGFVPPAPAPSGGNTFGNKYTAPAPTKIDPALVNPPAVEAPAVVAPSGGSGVLTTFNPPGSPIRETDVAVVHAGAEEPTTTTLPPFSLPEKKKFPWLLVLVGGGAAYYFLTRKKHR